MPPPPPPGDSWDVSRGHSPVGLAGHVLRRGELSAPGRDLAAREAEEQGGSGRQSPLARPGKERGERLPRRCLWRRGSEAQEWKAPARGGTRGDTRACGNVLRDVFGEP